MNDVLTMIERGVLHLAEQPLGQPMMDALRRAQGYTIPLIAHDYPAKTALLWNAMYRALGMPYVNAMVVAPPETAAQVLDVFRADSKYLGGGAGVGFKDVVPSHLDSVEGIAQAIGAVNIISRGSNGKLRGHNTDGAGFVRGLGPLLRAKGVAFDRARAVVLGAGGAGDAIAFALASAGCQVAIVNRTVEKARRLAWNIHEYRSRGNPSVPIRAVAHGEDELLDVLPGADIVVNTTPKGQGDLREYSALGPVRTPGDPDDLRRNSVASAAAFAMLPTSAIICDIVLEKQPTPLLVEASARGHVTQDGNPMVVEQAIDAFLLVHPDAVPRERIAELMWAAVAPSVVT